MPPVSEQSAAISEGHVRDAGEAPPRSVCRSAEREKRPAGDGGRRVSAATWGWGAAEVSPGSRETAPLIFTGQELKASKAAFCGE